jgi:hypothetical protein
MDIQLIISIIESYFSPNLDFFKKLIIRELKSEIVETQNNLELIIDKLDNLY